MILCIAGKKGSGKDTVADILIKHHEFKKVSLADELKIMCSRVFDYPNRENYDPALKEKKWPSPQLLNASHIGRLTKYLENRGFTVTEGMVLEMFNVGMNKIFETPRQLLQFVGTDMIRDIVDPDVWIKLTKRELGSYAGNVVIPDARFENEREAFRSIGGKLALVIRPNTDIEYESQDTHKSENQLGTEDDYDYIFYNNSTLARLEREIILWYSSKKG